MKSSIHLFYGIIIGILLFASTGSFKKDKAEFDTYQVFEVYELDPLKFDSKTDRFIAQYKLFDEHFKRVMERGWTFIDWQKCPITGRNDFLWANTRKNLDQLTK